MKVSISAQNISVTAVIAAARKMHSHRELVTYLRSCLKSPAPNIWATGMENPLQTPITKPITRKFTEPVLPTAARAL